MSSKLKIIIFAPQATYDIAIKVAESLNLPNLDFYIYALYNTLKARNHILVNKI